MSAQFHLALPCRDIETTRQFYTTILGAKEGRSAENWVDINFYTHQITFTASGDFNFNFKSYRFGNAILPSFHFGAIIDANNWNTLYKQLQEKDIDITVKTTFLEGKSGMHTSYFIKDPNEYMIEFKCFKDAAAIF